MKDILKTIVEAKYKEVEEQQKQVPLQELKKLASFTRPVISLSEKFRLKSTTGIIAEFKRKSPSKGIINNTAGVKDVVSAYEKYGAAAVSVLTDAAFFGGSATDFSIARENLHIPLLRKEFIVDEYQVFETRAMGADLILLIAACLTVEQVKKLSSLAVQLGLEVLLELHGDDELGHICADTLHIGINNRDLKNFSVDTARSIEMAGHIPQNKFKIAESGISTPAQVAVFRENAFDGFLIGENFMKEENPGMAFKSFAENINIKEKLR